MDVPNVSSGMGQVYLVDCPTQLICTWIFICCVVRRQCKIFASGVNFSIFTHFFVFFLTKTVKLGEIDGEKFLA